MKSTHCFPLLLCAALALLAGCQKRNDAPESATTQPASEPRTGAPALDELQNMTFSGFEGLDPVALQDGLWPGPPDVEGGASRPEIRLLGDLVLEGDLDADGTDETVAFLSQTTGGTGNLLYLAVAKRVDGVARNMATALVGDRVQVRRARIEAGNIVLEVVQAGPDDALCCPGELATRTWSLFGSAELRAQETSGATGRLSLQTLGGTDWVLRFWEWGVPAPQEPEVTLRLEGNRLSGKNGCNDYFTTVSAGAAPGDVTLGPVGATRMACLDAASAVENRFMQQLHGVRKYGFLLTRLALTYEVDGRIGVMLFEPRTAESKGSN